MSGATRPQVRPLRATRNDATILEAATRLVATDGWAGLLFPRVAADAGLSVRPLHERFADREQLAVALWRQRLSGEVLESLATLVASLQSPKPDVLTAALETFVRPSIRLQAASELMMMAATTPELLDAIYEELAPQWNAWLAPRGKVTKGDAGRHAYVIALALGLLMVARRYPQRTVDLSSYAAHLHTAIHERRTPARLPAQVAEHLDVVASFGTDDPAWEELLAATLVTVGEVGYDRATVSVISEAAGYTKGLLFRRYATKRELFLDATQRVSASSMEANIAFQKGLEENYSPGIASTVTIREFMRPGREILRNIFIEQLRLAIHDPEFRAAIDAEVDPVLTAASADSADGLVFVHTGQAMANGIIQLQVLWPDAWQLPFDVVEVPLTELV